MNNQERNTETVLDREDGNSGRASRAGQSLKESLGHLGSKIGTVRDTVVDKTKDYWHTTDNYVGKNPWVAVGISAGVAFLAGMLISRRRNN